jgi:hypothetical protein
MPNVANLISLSPNVESKSMGPVKDGSRTFARGRCRRNSRESFLGPVPARRVLRDFHTLIIPPTTLPYESHSRARMNPLSTYTTPIMPSQEARILGDFLLAPAPVRDFINLREFTDIFPRAHRTNPAVHDIYRELQRLRERDIELVRRDIVDEVKRSKQLRREYAQERRQLDDATVAGLDPIALQMEEEVLCS